MYKFFTIFLSLLIIVISLESFCRFFLNLGNPVVYDSSILWGYSPKPNQKTKRFRNSEITINNIGTRSIYKWDENQEKIIFFGDSVTYGGSYIDDKKTFSHLVCEDLKKFSCFNAGVNGYGIYNIVNRSRFDDRLQNSSIRIFVLINEDFFRGLTSKYNAHFFFRDLNKYLPGLHELINFFFTKYNPRDLLSKKVKNEKVSELAKKKSIINGVEQLTDEYKRLVNLGNQVYFYLSPNINEFKSSELNEQSNLIIEIGKQFQIKINSLLPGMISSEIEVDKIFYDKVHLEKNGHRILSRIMIKDLLK